MSQCPSNFNLNAFYDDRLRLAERERMQAHVDACPSCALELQTLGKLSRLLASSPAPAMPEGLRQRLYAAARESAVPGLIRLVKVLTAAAAVILLTASLGLLHMRTAPAQATVLPAPWEQTAIAADPSADAMADTGMDRGDLRFASWAAEDLSRRARGGQN